MPKKTIVELLELDALAEVIDRRYGTVRLNVANMLKNNQPLEFGENGRYKLFGEKNKKWYAYDSEKYEIVIKSAEKSTEVQPKKAE